MESKNIKRTFVISEESNKETVQLVNCSENFIDDDPDIDEEYLMSVLKATRNVKMKPPICLYSIKLNGLGLAAVDVKELCDIAYANTFSSEIHVLSCHESIVSEMKSEDEESLLSRPTENEAKNEVSEKIFQINVLQHSTDVTALSYTNGHLLLSGSLDGTVKVWSRNYQLIHIFSDIMKSLSDIHASCRMDYFVTSSLIGLRSLEGDKTYGASLFSFSRKDPIMSFLGHTAGTQCVRFHPNGKYVATTSLDNTIKMWDSQTSKSVRTFQDESQEYRQLKKVIFSPDGKYLASTYYGSVKIWDLASGQLVKKLGEAHPTNSIYNICYSKSGLELAAGGSNGVLKVWNMKDFSVASSVANVNVDLLDSHEIHQPIFKITCTNNIFSCVSTEL